VQTSKRTPPVRVVIWRLETDDARVRYDGRVVLDDSETAIDHCRTIREHCEVILLQPNLFTAATVARAKVIRFCADVLATEREAELQLAKLGKDAVFSFSLALLQTSLERHPPLGSLRTPTGSV
jgi:hypothetical protein